MDDDAALVVRIARGEQDALHELHRRYYPRLFRHIHHQLNGDVDRVEDVVQEVFWAVWQTAHQYRGQAKVTTWLFQIAHYQAMHAIKTRQYAMEAPWPMEEAPEAASQHHMEDVVLERLTLAQAFGRLTIKHRTVLDLAFNQGFNDDEVAQIIGVPVGTVKSRISYARQALLRELRATTAQEELIHDA